jgi:hypothetical protein
MLNHSPSLCDIKLHPLVHLYAVGEHTSLAGFGGKSYTLSSSQARTPQFRG